LNEAKLQYYCSNCNTVLKETQSNLKLAYLVEPCPSCGSLLSESLQKRSTIKKINHSIFFQSALNIPQLRFDIEKLDPILNFLRPNQVVRITGYHCQKLVERLCVRALLPKRHGGLDSNVLVIDGGNSSDPSLCINFARQYGLQVDNVLSKIITSRAFTVYQLSSLVTHHLQNAITKYNTKLVVISELCDMFSDDPFLDQNEATLILQDMINSISKIQDCIIVVSISKPTKYDNVINRMLDRAIRISRERDRLSIKVDNNDIVIKETELEIIPQR